MRVVEDGMSLLKLLPHLADDLATRLLKQDEVSGLGDGPDVVEDPALPGQRRTVLGIARQSPGVVSDNARSGDRPRGTGAQARIRLGSSCGVGRASGSGTRCSCCSSWKVG